MRAYKSACAVVTFAYPKASEQLRACAVDIFAFPNTSDKRGPPNKAFSVGSTWSLFALFTILWMNVYARLWPQYVNERLGFKMVGHTWRFVSFEQQYVAVKIGPVLMKIPLASRFFATPTFKSELNNTFSVRIQHKDRHSSILQGILKLKPA